MSKNLVIVESPAKAKTIEGYLGNDFTVKSSYGHVRDLPKSGLAINIENGFEPVYEVTEDKQAVVNELKKLAAKADTVWLATDEDREGEAISWHLMEALKLDKSRIKRIVFHEITKKAIQKAIENPRSVDIDLVNAQQARRVLDRLVGFELSPVLWKKVRPSLSAGRVQSVAVRILVEREREIDNFKSTAFFNIRGLFDLENATLKAELSRKIKDYTEAENFLKKSIGAKFSITDIETKPAKRTPAAPFTTSTLQQEAGRKLGFSVAQTMTVAQRLYESGKITYMRTDSVNLSDFALDACKNEITSSFGGNYSKTRQYNTKSKGAQEAHEAIRPTEMSAREIEGERNEIRLYDLIWKRTLASQMADAEIEKTTVTIGISTLDEMLLAKGEVIRFDGFLKVYMESSDEDESEDGNSGMLPPLKVGQTLSLSEMTATQRFTQRPPRYSEAALVKKLEELGIGRPSTYAPTISTIQKREYVVKEERLGTERQYEVLTLKGAEVKKEIKTEVTGTEKGKLFPTDIGMVVNDFLVENFPQILDYQFTAKVEEEFDIIAEGKLQWQEMMKRFYKPFHIDVVQTLETAQRATGERELGTDPATGKPVIARIGRFGPMVQIGASDDESKKFASLRSEQSIGNITLEEALKLFELPRILGEYEGKPVSASIGRFGPYIKYGNVFASLKAKEGDDPHTVTFERAVEIIQAKALADSQRIIREFDRYPDIQVLNGRFGPYIKNGKSNVKIPKDKEAAKLTIEEVLDLIKVAEENPGQKRGKFGKVASKAAEKKAFAKKTPSKKTVAKKGTTKK
ncbi:MAG: type I DNA topoisomerase [Crocinitomicaceae bacterium]|nr:type I DNA topoisomerase [Crocinitomicaceae bacterium]